MGEPHQIDVRLDGTLLQRFTIGGEGKGMTAPESFAGNTQGEPQWEEYMHTADAGLIVPYRSPPARIASGSRSCAGTGNQKACCSRRSVASRARPTSCTSATRQSIASRSPGRSRRSRRRTRLPAARCSSAGPPRRRRGRLCAAHSVHDRPSRYRGPVTEGDVNTLLAFYRAGRAEDGFDAGIQQGLVASSHRRDFFSASSTSRRRSGQPYRVSDLDLASRLSFFLEQHPDEELLAVAVKGTLSDRASLERQVRRMLADRRAQALVDNFASQWLTVRKARWRRA